MLGALSFPVLGWVTLAVQSWATCLPGARRWLAFLTTEDRGQMPFLRRKIGGPSHQVGKDSGRSLQSPHSFWVLWVSQSEGTELSLLSQP